MLTPILWLFVWGGMFTGIYNLQGLRLSDPLSLFQAVRAFFPLFAAYLGLIWMLVKRPGSAFLRMPAGFLFVFFGIGAVSSIFLSLNRMTALYWAGEYLAPLSLSGWPWRCPTRCRELEEDPDHEQCHRHLHLLRGASRSHPGRGSDQRFSQFYRLPLNFGDMRANGVGRFALVTVIIAFTELICRKGRSKLFWGVRPAALFMLAQTRSRTSLLGSPSRASCSS